MFHIFAKIITKIFDECEFDTMEKWATAKCAQINIVLEKCSFLRCHIWIDQFF